MNTPRDLTHYLEEGLTIAALDALPPRDLRKLSDLLREWAIQAEHRLIGKTRRTIQIQEPAHG